MTRYCYFNGKIMPEDKAGVAVRDLGVLRGYGVFDFLRTYQGKPFHFGEHMKRFRHSAEALGLRVPLPDNRLKSALGSLLKKNNFPKESAIRFMLLGGASGDGMHYDRRAPTFFILAEPFQPLADHFFARGVAIATKEHMRELPEVKTINYLAAVKSHNDPKNGKVFEILYTWRGLALECTTANFFIFKNNTLITSRKNILKGVTRSIVLDLARARFNIEERDVSIEEVFAADEAFLTGSNKEIVPVIKINGKKIGNGKAGNNTKYLMRAFREYTAGI